LIDKDRPLRHSKEGDEVRTLARARTLTVLTRLDGVRKGSVLRFLYESNLIVGESPILSLVDADLQEATMNTVSLSNVNLTRTNLRRAYFFGVNFNKALLSGANLDHATFVGVNFANAILRSANLCAARLSSFSLDAPDTFFINHFLQGHGPGGPPLQVQVQPSLQALVKPSVETCWASCLGQRALGLLSVPA
jgi:Pentapeptide repeats (9 copies)